MSAPNFPYYEIVNPHVLRLIPLNAPLIVEVGCAAGGLGKEYKRLNPHSRYVGIEANPEVAARAAQSLDRVIAGNAEQLGATACGLEEGSVDCLVYADVLEHLVDPWSTLKRQVAWLKPDGVVVASIPNVSHWSVIYHLLCDEWPHLDSGLFDRTHLRFFTLGSIKALIAQAGLHLTDVQFVENGAPGLKELQTLLIPVIQAMGGSVTRFTQHTRAFQYLIRASRSAPRQQPAETGIILLNSQKTV